MKTTAARLFFLVFITGHFTLNLRATTFYVTANGANPTPPYADWTTAATNIQDAVAIAQEGDAVDVGAGVYSNGGAVIYGEQTNVVALTNGITLLGVDGWQSTMIVGSAQTRCVYVGSNSILNGFTITNGYTRTNGDLINEQSGGGIWCQPGALVANCLIISNFVAYNQVRTNLGYYYYGGYGGGVYCGTVSNCTLAFNKAPNGGGAGGGAILWNCILTNNVSSDGDGGGASGSVLYGCLLESNESSFFPASGTGGALSNCLAFNCIITNNNATAGGGTYNGTNYDCLIVGNSAGGGGGTYQSTNFNCEILGNSASAYGGGAVGGILYNCLLTSNRIPFVRGSGTGIGAGAYWATLYSCTVVSNSAAGGGGGVFGGSAYNSIIYDNSAPSPFQNYENSGPLPFLKWTNSTTFFYSCTTPSPTNGWGNITNDPAFVNPDDGDYHLQSNSPCINAGDNYYVSATNDLDGNPRISGGTVDMGAYEFQNPSSILSYAWAQQYGLPTDGSADYADMDGTGMPNWEKAIAGLNPTNSASVLMMSPPTPMNDGSGTTLTWQSVTAVAYYVQRSSDLTQPFVTIQDNIMGQAGTTSFLDMTATNAGPYFYRVGVQ